MNQILFYNSFDFRHLSFSSQRHTDNSRGIRTHYVARMTRGTGHIRSLDGSELYLKAGDIFYLPMGLQYHSYWFPDHEGQVEWESFSFLVIPTEQKNCYTMQILDPTAEAIALLAQMISEPTVSPASVGCLYQFLGLVMPSMTQDRSDPKTAQLEKAKRYIASHLDFTVPELARHCGISESGLYAMFQVLAGTSPIEMKHRLQIERGVTLLCTTDLSVEEISTRLGFHSAGYFRRICKSQTGKTPTQLRKEGVKKSI